MRVKFKISFNAQIASSGRYPATCSCWGTCCCLQDRQIRRDRMRAAKKHDARDVADLILHKIPVTKEEADSLRRGRDTWITCSPEFFMKFLVARRDAGYVNNIRSLQIELIDDDRLHRKQEVNDLFTSAMIFPHKDYEVQTTASITSVKKRQKKRHIFFVLNGKRYDAPDWLRNHPKTDGWYFCTEGEPYVTSMPFATKEEISEYLR